MTDTAGVAPLEVDPGQLRLFPLWGIGKEAAEAFRSAIDSSVADLTAGGADPVEVAVYVAAALAVELAMRAPDPKPGPLIAALRLLRDVHRDLCPGRADGVDVGDVQWLADIGAGALGNPA